LAIDDARLSRGDVDVELRPKALAVLCHLVERPGRIVGKQELLGEVWAGTSVSDTVLKVCIREIRDALGDDAKAPRYVETVPRRGYRFVERVVERAESPPEPDAAHSDPFANVVGRDDEVRQLTEWLEAAEAGQRKIVFVTGEPGIGKTTLVDLFLRRARVSERMEVSRGQCLERYGEGEAYLPVLEALGRLCRGPGGERVVALLRQYAPSWLVQMPALVQDETLEALQRKVQGTTHERMLREITEAIETFASEQGLVFVFEDLQWSDYSTLELVSYLAHRRETVRLMVIATYRPAEVALKQHPLLGIKRELHVHGQCEEIALPPLTEAQVRDYVDRRVPRAASAPALGQLVHRRTDGNALFMVNMIDYALGRGLVGIGDAGDAPSEGMAELERSVPEDLRELIQKQIDGASGSSRPVLEVASVAGRRFAAAAVAAGARCEPEAVETQCDALAGRGHVLRKREVAEWPDGTVSACYGFIHKFYQQVLYEEMGDAQRVRVHRAIGECKEAAYGRRAGEIAGELALHFEQGRDWPRALRYHRAAAEAALHRCAHQEAVRHLRAGLALLPELADAPERLHQELTLQATLGRALLPGLGPAAPEVQQAYARARELCEEMGDVPEVSPVLFGLLNSYQIQGELQAARKLGVQLRAAAERAGDATALQRAHLALGSVLFWCGELAHALSHFEQSVVSTGGHESDPMALLYAFDARVRSLSFMAMILYVQGYADQSLARSRESLEVADALGFPFDRASARVFAALLHQYRREPAAITAHVEAGQAVADEYGFPLFHAAARVLHGWALADTGDLTRGVAEMEAGVAATRAAHNAALLPYFLTLVADGHRKTGQYDRALAALAEGLQEMEGRGERVISAELHRVRGVVLLYKAGLWESGRSGVRGRAAPPGEGGIWEEAEASLRHAIQIARQQDARAWELRAAMSLARLLREQRKEADARRVLGEAYGRFTEGFATRDLEEARELLSELERSGGEGRGARRR
jgi:DNA-binding winged helix-turn-helix (wHTH) protein/predicted ATPase